MSSGSPPMLPFAGDDRPVSAAQGGVALLPSTDAVKFDGGCFPSLLLFEEAPCGLARLCAGDQTPLGLYRVVFGCDRRTRLENKEKNDLYCLVV